MKVSPTYADREDLSWFEKQRFTLEEVVCRNETARAFYRYFYGDWKKTANRRGWLEASAGACFYLFVFTFVPFEWVSERFSDDEDSPLILVPWALCLLAFFIFVPFGWIVLFPFLYGLGWVEFMNCMENYDEELGIARKWADTDY